MNLIRIIFKPLTLAAAIFGCFSCVNKDYTMASNFLATNQQFDIFTAEFPLEDIQMLPADSLSGYSQTRITFGAIRDKDFGLTTRSSAITLVPLYDSLDFGENAKFKYFRFNMVIDTTSTMKDMDKYIHQNIGVYELSEPLDSTYDINTKLKHGSKRISKGIPVYNGVDDSLGFFFTKEFGEKYMNITLEDTKDMDSYTKKFPGICFESDIPSGEGGRINMFKLQLQYSTTSVYLEGNFAELAFTSEYDGEEKDTSFVFYFCPDKFYDMDSLLYNATGDLPQYCLNVATHESTKKAGEAEETLLVEGGGGLKPVISATEIREKILNEISRNGNPEEATINRASITFPFVFPEDYKDMEFYPQMLSPTCRIRTSTGRVSFSSLTDSSDDDEDQGDVNRSKMVYAPDITYHTQSILNLTDLEKIHNYDVWLLIMAYETTVTSTSAAETDELTDYYSSLLYSSYYNDMYSGYGGYGGYGYGGYGYGDSYSNYYSYMLMQQYYNSTGSTTSYTLKLDTDRYYHGVLRGPANKEAVPTMRIVYSLPRNAQ